MSKQFRIVAFNDPIGSEPVECFADGGQTIREVFPDLSSQVEVVVNGNPLHDEYYDCHTLEGGDLVTMVRMPAGDSDTRKEIGRQAFILSLQIAAAYFTAGSSIWVQMGAQAVAAIGGNVIADQVGLVATPDIRRTEPDSTEFDRRGALTGSRNRLAPYSVVPKVYGHMRMYPPMAAKPYTEVIENEQYLRLLFMVGDGPVQISNPKIGDTAIGSFDSNNQFTSNDIYENVEIEVGESPSLYARDVNQENISFTLENLGDNQIQTTVEDTDEASVGLTFPRGLFGVNEDGDIISRRVGFTIEYRPVGSSEWTSVNGYKTETQCGGDGSGGDGRLKQRHTRITDFEDCTQVQTDDPVPYYRSNDEKETMRVAVSFDFPQPGQYEVKVTRVTAKGNDDQSQGTVYSDNMAWTTFKSIKRESPVNLPGTVLMAMRIKATDQLNGILDEFNVEVKSRLSYYDGSQWNHPTFNADNGTGTGGMITSSPSWILADLFCGDMNQQATSYNQLDGATFKYWDDNYGSEFQFNSVIDSNVTVKQLADNIASAGRASWGIQDGTYTPILDEPNESPVQMFTPRNSAEFGASKEFPEELHGLKMKFRNADNGWQEDEAIVYQDGYSADGTNCLFGDGTGNCKQATKFQEVQLDGVTSWDQAWRLGRYKLAERVLRPEVFTYKTDVEHLRCQRGDVVFMASDVTLWGSTWGRVKAVTRNGSNEITALTLDQEVVMQSGKDYNIRVRLQDSSFALLPVATDEGASTEITIDTPQQADVNKGDLFAFGEDGGEAVPLKVIDIRPGNDLSATLTLVDRADDIHSADSGEIPAYDPQITNPVDFDDTQPGAPSIENIRSDDSSLYKDEDGTFRLRMLISFTLPEGSPVTEVEARYRASDSPSGWIGKHAADASLGVVGLPDVARGKTYVIQVRSRYKNNTSEWTGNISHTVEGKNNSPSTLTTYNVVVDKTQLRHTWNDPTDTDIEKFELRRGADWATGSFVDRTKGTTITSDIPGDGSFTYWVKAIDTSGNYSGAAISDSVTIDSKYTDDPTYPTDGAYMETDFSNVSDWTPPDSRYVRPNTEPTLTQLLLNNPPSQDAHAVRAGKEIVTSDPLDGGDKLLNLIDLKLKYNTTNLKITSGELNTIQDIHEDADMLLNGLTLKEFLSSQAFAGGYGGDGTELREVNGNWQLTVDDLIVRRLARFYETAIERIRQNAGTVVFGPGGEKTTNVTENDSFYDTVIGNSSEIIGQSDKYLVRNWTCDIEEDKLISITNDDLLRRQEWNGRGTGVTEATVLETVTGAVDPEDNTTTRSFTISITSGSEIPSAGMEFAVVGNKSDPQRQNCIIITASDAGNPYKRILAGVDSHAKFGSTETIVGHDGRLDNLNFSHLWPELDGSQTNEFGVVWPNGNFYVNDGHFRGRVEITNPDESNVAIKDDVEGKIGEALDSGSTIIIGGLINTDIVDADEVIANAAEIGGFSILNLMLTAGENDNGDPMISLDAGAAGIRLLTQTGNEELWIGGDFNFDSEDDVSFHVNDFTDSITYTITQAIADSGSSPDSADDRFPANGYRECITDLDPSYEGRYYRFLMDWEVIASPGSQQNQNNDTVYGNTLAELEIIFEIRDSSNNVLDTHSMDRQEESTRTTPGGSAAGTFGISGEIPVGADHVRLRYAMYSESSTNIYLDPEGNEQHVGGNSRTEVNGDDNPLLIYGVNEFLSPLGWQLINEGSGQTTDPRVWARRENGELGGHRIMLEDGDSSDTAWFEISSGQVRLMDDGGVIQSWPLN